jgi:large subunit ribosomal protein L1
MSKLSKKQKAIREKIVPGKQYPIDEAVNIINSLPPAKFAESIAL